MLLGIHGDSADGEMAKKAKEQERETESERWSRMCAKPTGRWWAGGARRRRHMRNVEGEETAWGAGRDIRKTLLINIGSSFVIL